MSTALYRRYRPESFADVIGQEHVTAPLMTALAKDRVNHAYLFSGPRGCGKTTSARILARCLNCAQGPTPTPCGVCESCVDLSRDGGGSLDVIEMDAASHGGVDHARDLRERATFAPVRDRYKIFIIDEAHMVTREGFNALLKIVEEPPEHIKFIFATTEPNKVLGTIRSRTHHYPFRLIPPETLGGYLQQLCGEEQIEVQEGVLPLVVRAGGGSVRDSLSILDQLMAGASQEQGITYDLAVALLGFTHGGLLDEVLDAFASGSAATVFAAVDRVIQTGQDPRRFVEDLLERFRDLIIVKAVPDAAASILRGLPADQLERMRSQAEQLGAAELSRAADITNEALNEMSGATNPQLNLELLCARILLAAGDSSVGSLGARLEQLERKVSSGDIPARAPAAPVSGRPRPGRAGQEAAASAGASAEAPGGQLAPATTPATAPLAGAPLSAPPLAQAPLAGTPLAGAPLAGAPLAPQGQQVSAPQQTATQRQNLQGQDAQGQDAQGQQAPAPLSPAASVPPAPASAPAPAQAPQQGVPGQNTVDMVRHSWQEVVARVPAPFARTQFALCEPVRFENGALFLRAEIQVLRSVKDYLPLLQNALNSVLQLQVQIRGEVKKPGDGSGGPGGQGPQGPQGPRPDAPAQGGSQPQPAVAQPAPSQPSPAVQQTPQQVGQQHPAPAPQPVPPAPEVPVAEGPRGGEQAWAAHGQPRSEAPPTWSQDDWNNPVTSWDVAPIPAQGDATAAPAPVAEEAPAEPAPHQPPHLRVIDGEADPLEAAKAHHPSRRPQERHPMSLAPEVETPGADSPGAGAPAQATPAPTTGQVAVQAPAPRPALAPEQIAHEYADYDAGYFDDAPADEPEYIAGQGYVAQPASPSQAPQTAETAGEKAVEAPVPSPAIAEAPAPQPAPAPLAKDPAPGAPLATTPAPGAPLAGTQPSTGQAPQSAPQEAPQQGGPQATPASGRLSFRERHAAQIAAGQRAVQSKPSQAAESAPEDFTPSDEDVALESTVLIGQRAVEKILGGKVIDEQPLHQP